MISRREVALTAIGIAAIGRGDVAAACSPPPYNEDDTVPLRFLESLATGKKSAAEAFIAEQAEAVWLNLYSPSTTISSGRANVVTSVHKFLADSVAGSFDNDAQAVWKFGPMKKRSRFGFGWLVVPCVTVAKSGVGLSVATCNVSKSDQIWFVISSGRFGMPEVGAPTLITRIVHIADALAD